MNVKLFVSGYFMSCLPLNKKIYVEKREDSQGNLSIYLELHERRMTPEELCVATIPLTIGVRKESPDEAQDEGGAVG